MTPEGAVRASQRCQRTASGRNERKVIVGETSLDDRQAGGGSSCHTMPHFSKYVDVVNCEVNN